MKINKKIKEQREKDINYLHKLVSEKNEKNKEDLYITLKETFNEKQIIDKFYSYLEDILSITLKEVKKIYKTYDEHKKINLKDLFYNKDGITLEERIHKWFETYNENQIMNLFHRLCLILDTESCHIVNSIPKEKTKVIYVEIIGGGEDCFTGICEEYRDGELHKEENFELPPYHPGCLCEAVFYEKQDIEEDL